MFSLISHLPTEPGPAAGEGVGVLEPTGEPGIASAVAVKSSLQIGEEELNNSTSNRLRNLKKKMSS